MNVLKAHLRIIIDTLHRTGTPQREIQRRTGVDRKTIRRYARLPGIRAQLSAQQHALDAEFVRRVRKDRPDLWHWRTVARPKRTQDVHLDQVVEREQTAAVVGERDERMSVPPTARGRVRAAENP